MLPPKETESGTELIAFEHKRATPLRPAIWMTGVLVWATVIALFLRVPTWAGIFLCMLTGLSFLSYLVPYIYLMVYDREALRPERLKMKELPVSSPELIESVEQRLPEAQRDLLSGETSRLKLDQTQR